MNFSYEQDLRHICLHILTLIFENAEYLTFENIKELLVYTFYITTEVYFSIIPEVILPDLMPSLRAEKRISLFWQVHIGLQSIFCAFIPAVRS